jgi:hypothetical protein
VAASRQIPKAEPDSDGAVAWTVGAVPIGETEAAGIAVPIAFDWRLLVGLVGSAEGGEASGLKGQVQSPFHTAQSINESGPVSATFFLPCLAAMEREGVVSEEI